MGEGRRGREESEGERRSSPRDGSHFRREETRGERERQGEKEKERDAGRGRKGREKEKRRREKEEDFPSRTSLHDEKISIERERGRERKLGGENSVEKRE